MNIPTETVQGISHTEHKHSLVMIASVSLALVASLLIAGERLGLNFVLFSAICLITMEVMRRYIRRSITKIETGLIVAGLLLVLSLIFRYSEVLYYLDILGIITVICLAFSLRYQGKLTEIPAMQWLSTPLQLIYLLWRSVCKLITIGLIPSWLNMRSHSHIRSISLGLLWASPILLVFGSLLVSADSRFEAFAANLFSCDISKLIETAMYILLYFPLISTFLYAALLGKAVEPTVIKPFSWRLDGVQLLTILICVNLLFLTYIALQFGYFFGGDEAVQSSSNLTYSAYARRGFWEFIWISLIILPLLLIGHWLQRDENPKFKMWFKGMAALLVFSVVIIEISAMHRMYLYITTYRLTELRFYSSVFMLYMILGLIGFFLTVLRGLRGRYVVTMAGQAVVFILALNIVNPDAWIANFNLSHDKSKMLDNQYLSSLSVDAYPAIYSAIKRLPSSEACFLHARMQQKIPSTSTIQWNWSVYQANNAMTHWLTQCKSL